MMKYSTQSSLSALTLSCALLLAPTPVFSQTSTADAISPSDERQVPYSWIDNRDHVLYKKELEIIEKLHSEPTPEAPPHSMIVRARKIDDTINQAQGEESLIEQFALGDSTTPYKTESQIYTGKLRACCGEPALIRAVQDAKPLKFGSIEIRDDMPLALISLKDTNLLSGPARDYMTLTRVPLGTQVAIETRHENWYRIITEDGIRGWVHSDVLLFGPDSRTLPTLYIKVRGYEPESDRLDWEE